MLEIRKSEDRGRANHGWLDARHTFSFASYYDEAHMGFGPLRVINEDRVAAGKGFGTHGHRDMEIITYVLEGEVAHRDSMGNGSTIRPGDVQRMSAGTGVQHSEFNPSEVNKTHLLQIWIEPDKLGVTPSYEEKRFPEEDKRGHLRLIASPDGENGSVRLHQDAKLYVGLFDDDEKATLPLASGRRAFVHIARGEVEVNGIALKAGDALKATDVAALDIDHGKGAEVLVFDLV
ncbi:MAG TPA: pirin family protein [Oxalicibacterium sp.]|nr:pirin family protein [Oxalicibacterium sp.]